MNYPLINWVQYYCLKLMQFLSSKLVHGLETAFSNILDHQRVKEGQSQLQKLRVDRQFELALGTFISRSQDYHKRLLAILQLQKRMVIEEIQTVWSLKQVYFRDSDKIAKKIRKIITLKENIKMASEFLVFDTYVTGSAVQRQIQIVFSLLKIEEKAKYAIEFHFKALYQYFIDAVSIIQNHQPCFFMIIVSLALFCQVSLKNSPTHQQKIYSLWKQIQSKWGSSQVDGVFLVYYFTKMTIFNERIDYRQTTLNTFLNTMFSKRSLIDMSYYSKCFQIIGRQGIVLQRQKVRQQFIQSILLYNRNKNSQMLLNIKIYGNQSVEVQNQMSLEDKNELMIRQVSNKFIKIIFSHYYQWLNQSYLTRLTFSERIQAILAMINYYNSSQLPNLQCLLPTLTEKVSQQLQNYIPTSNLTNIQKNICITYISFLTKFRAQIQLCQLPNIVDLFAKVSQACPILSPFCDAFLSLAWKQLTYLPFNQLVSFLQLHFQKTNENEWAIRFQRYECFLRLAVYLEQSNSYFSNCTENDDLLVSVLKSHSIICEYLAQNDQKIDFEIFHIFLSLTKSVIQNDLFKRNKSMYGNLNVPFLIDKIEKHLFLNEDTAIIVAFYRYHTKILLNCLYEQKQKWEIDYLDYNYRISLYMAEIQFATGLISSVELSKMKEQLGEKIVQFIKTVSSNELHKIKQAKLWDKIQNEYSIRKYLSQQMDIQTI